MKLLTLKFPLIFLALTSCFAVSSCSKNSTEAIDKNDLAISVVATQNAQQYQNYGLIGDGITDNTAALQKLIDGTPTVYLKAGTYIINQTINLKSGSKIYGEAATIIKAGNNMSGTLLTNARYFFVNSTDNVLIHQLTFSPSDNAYQLSTWNNACIFLLNSKNATIENSNFAFHLPYSTLGLEAVWVSGTGSANTNIKSNTISTLGIKYAENGADGTVVQNNVLNNAYSNALTANGNHATDYSTGCQIMNNTINNAGRMGIEDWGNTDGSIIQGNKITGSGKDSNQAIDGIGLSAVGTNVKVMDNVITDTKLYAIEVRGNYNITVSGNTLADNPLCTAIILNYTFAVPAKATAGSVAAITGNKISNSKIGIHVFGDYQASANIQSNTFTNVISKGISIESGAQTYKLDIKNNKFNYSVPAPAERYGLFSYTKYNPGTANQVINLATDTLNYSAGAAGGAGLDMGLVIRTDHALISNLLFNGNSNKSSSGTGITAVTAFGGKPAGLTMTNNKVYGATVNLTGFSAVVSTGNNY